MYAEFVIEGEKLIGEALVEKYPVKLILAKREWLDRNEKNISSRIQVAEITDRELKQISSQETPQGVLAIASVPDQKISFKFDGGWSVALDRITDPGNLGTIIRSADWFGIKNVFCSSDCVDVYNPKTVQATMGSVVRMNIFYGDLHDILKKARVKKVAATLSGISVQHYLSPGEGILLIGNESHGIREELISLCDEQITIDRLGKAESLNAAVACSIILSHIIHRNAAVHSR